MKIKIISTILAGLLIPQIASAEFEPFEGSVILNGSDVTESVSSVTCDKDEDSRRGLQDGLVYCTLEFTGKHSGSNTEMQVFGQISPDGKSIEFTT